MASPGGSLSESQKDAVRGELERVLASAVFRGSKRSQEFLRYTVTHALEGRTALLKERTIGVEVFERDADYDTGDNSIVRVKANEVRKRLAQYYQEAGAAADVQIELPCGSYVPEFRWACATPARPRSASGSRRTRVLAVVSGLAVLCAAALWVWTGRSGASALDEFWQPFLRTQRPVLLCVPNPTVFHVNSPERDNPAGMVPSSAIVPDRDNYVGVGDAFALARLSTLLAQAGKPAQVRIGTDTSFADLRNAPAVLIGAYTNQWTMEITKDLRFTFDRENGNAMVKDHLAPGHRWARTNTDPPSDFAIISRVFGSRTGEPVIIAAGLGHFGTQVAGEFLTNADYFAEALRGAPAGWQTKNLQIVLGAEVIGRTPGPPKTLATHYW
ncbi:MAG: hypothetical protein ACM336_07830 [Acidobacteriota bacterium]